MRRWVVLLAVPAATLVLLQSVRAEIDWDEDASIRGRNTSRGDYRSNPKRLRNAFNPPHPGVYEMGDDARIVWRRAMGPHGGFNDMAAPAGPQGLKLTRKDDKIFVDAGNFRLFWWTTRGGEICDISLYNGRWWFPIIHRKLVRTIGLVGGRHNRRIPVGFRAFRADTMPNFVAECPADYAGNMPLYFLGEDKHTVFDIQTKGQDQITITATGNLASFSRRRCPLKVRQKFRIFAEGVVLCDFTISLDSKEPYTIREFGLGITLNDCLHTELYDDRPAHFMSRMGTRGKLEHKKFFNVRRHLFIDEHIPYFGASFSIPGRAKRSFSNALEITLESAKGMGGSVVTKPFYDKFDPYSLQYFYSLAWGLYATQQGEPLDLEPGFTYANKYALAFGSHRYGSAASLPRAMRNQLACQRITYWKNSDQAGAGKSWYPTNEDIDLLDRQGLDVLILGINWMARPGVPGKVVGDYQPADEDALKRVIAACHAKGIRVGLTMGGEYFVLADNETWITKYLKKDFDGVFVEEVNFLAPRGKLYPKSVSLSAGGEKLDLSDGQAGAHANFLLSRKLRKLVGEKGFLLGSSDIGPTAISLANFDAYVPGEALAASLSGRLDDFVYHSFMNSCGSVIPAEADARTILHAAGLGASFMRTITSRKDIAADLGVVGRLWKQFEAIDRDEVRLYNGLTEDTGMIRVSNAVGCVFVNGRGKGLLIVANPSRAKKSAKVVLDAKKLNIKTKTRTFDLDRNAVKAFVLD